MALLYIDGVFINPDQIVNVSKFTGGQLTVYLAVTHEDAVARLSFEGEAAKALHYYLFTHEDTVHIAAYVAEAAPAQVETGRKFKIGDPVIMRDENGDDIGRIIAIYEEDQPYGVRWDDGVTRQDEADLDFAIPF